MSPNRSAWTDPVLTSRRICDETRAITNIFVITVAVVLALLRITYKDTAPQNLDSTLLILFFSVVLILIVPWDRLRHIKAGGIEMALEQPQVQGAIAGHLNVDQERLQKVLLAVAPRIEQSKGGRILWIEDKPHTVVGEGRILRSLGMEIVPALPGNVADRIEEDNDFDLIVCDIQWIDTENRPTYGGMAQIKKLRETHPDPVIRSLPVVFYTAYSPERVSQITRQMGVERYLKVEFCYSVDELVASVINLVAENRSNPMKVSKKQPT